MSEFLSQPSVEIAHRLDMRGKHAWLAVLSPATDPTTALEGLQTELRSFLQLPTRTLALDNCTFEQLAAAVLQPSDDVVVLTAVADLAPERWSSLDVMRSALERAGPIIWWMVPDAVAKLTEFAPNIRSFIGSSIFIVSPEGSIMTDTERQKRLEELQQHYGLSSEEIVRRAVSKELPPEPHFVEWLVLLGRGDLV